MPSVRIPQLWAPPALTALKLPVGASVVPSHRAVPQQVIVLSVRIPQLWSPPALTVLNRPVGASVCPPWLDPQQLIVLSVRNPTGVAEIVGGEALPQTVLERLMCTAAVTGVVFDGEGQPLWVGRTHRHATEAQVKAIIARDRHCRGTGCTAGPERCEIHHIVP